MFQPLQKGGCGCPVSLRPTGDESAAIPSGALVRLVWGELPRRFSDRWCHWCPWLDRPGCKETAERTTGTGSGHHPWTLLDECCMETVSRHVLAYQNCRDLIFLMVFARDCRSFRFATMTWHEQKCFRHVVLRIGAPYHSLWHQISSYNFYHFLYLYMTVIVEYLSVFHNYIYIYMRISCDIDRIMVSHHISPKTLAPLKQASRARLASCEAKEMQLQDPSKTRLVVKLFDYIAPKTTSCKRYGLRYAWFTFCVHRTCFFCDS